MAWALRNLPAIEQYFPEPKEQVKLPRQWTINVLYSGIGDDFAEFVKTRTLERNQKVYI